MKNQVTSVEWSKRLIELGVPAEKASMVYRATNVAGIVRLEVNDGKGGIVAPAFTVADRLEMLPKTITDGRGATHQIHIGVCSSTNDCWCVYWGDDERQVGWQDRMSISDAIDDAIEWIFATGRKLNL